MGFYVKANFKSNYKTNGRPLASPFVLTFFVAPVFVAAFAIPAVFIFKTMFAYYVHDQDLVRNGTRTTATVTQDKYHPTTCRRYSGCYDWIVYYTYSADGRAYVSSVEYYLSRPVGSQLPIYYRNAYPNDTKPVDYITGLGELLVGPILLLLPSLFFAWLGTRTFRQWRKTGK